MNCLTARSIPLAALLNPLAGVGGAVRVRRQIDDAQVNPKHPIKGLRVRFGQVAHHQQVERAADVSRLLSFIKGHFFVYISDNQCAVDRR